jgi:hypothetical protein
MRSRKRAPPLLPHGRPRKSRRPRPRPSKLRRARPRASRRLPSKRRLRSPPPHRPLRIVPSAAHRCPFARHWRAVRRRPRSPLRRRRPASRLPLWHLSRRLRHIRPAVRCRRWLGRFHRHGPARCCPDRASRCHRASANRSLHRRRFSPGPVWPPAPPAHPYRRRAPPRARGQALPYPPRPDRWRRRRRARSPDNLPRVPWCRRVRIWPPG